MTKNWPIVCLWTQFDGVQKLLSKGGSFMKVKVSFHNVDHSDSLEEFIREKSSRLEYFLGDSEKLDWVVQFKGKYFDPILRLKYGGKVWSIHDRGANPYLSIQSVLKKAFRILEAQKSKLKVRIHDHVDLKRRSYHPSLAASH
jgi:ribosome-associated translation inhibitor RaiA